VPLPIFSIAVVGIVTINFVLQKTYLAVEGIARYSYRKVYSLTLIKKDTSICAKR
jgi:hypothetical protein